MERFVRRETGYHLQSAKIRQLGEVLIAAGYLHLDEQARVLGLSRSTAWTILRAKHKTSGLSASVIKRMLRQRQLPVLVRKKIFEYVGEKSAGVYGHNSTQVCRFVAALSPSQRVSIPTYSCSVAGSVRDAACCAHSPREDALEASLTLSSIATPSTVSTPPRAHQFSTEPN